MELKEGLALVSQRQIICNTGDDASLFTSRQVPFTDGNEEWQCHDMRMVKVWYRNGKEDALIILDAPKDDLLEIIAMWYLLFPVYHSVIQSGGVPFHAGLVVHEGKAVLLAAKGGTGKSTCCRRVPENWTALCDDEVLIVPGSDGRYQVHPIPTWSDYIWKRSEKTWNTQKSVSLDAVFFIHQAEESSAVPIGQGEAAALMYTSSIQIFQKYLRQSDDDHKRYYHNLVFDNSCALAVTTPAYRLGVSLEDRFWEEIERVLG